MTPGERDDGGSGASSPPDPRSRRFPATPDVPAPRPLILIAGFLGSGKTTLLRRLLPDLVARGIQPHVILNDYQDARIDAVRLQEFARDVQPITGTCVCCESQDDLLQALAATELGPRSVLLLEANGTADPTELLEILTAEWRASRYCLPVQVGVVDASRWQQRGARDELERLQVRTARFLTLTHRDSLPVGLEARLREELLELAPRARLLEPEALVDAIEELERDAASLPPRRFHVEATGGATAGSPGAPATHAHAATHHFSSLEVALPDRVRRERLVQALRSLPAEVLRAKGIARIGDAERVYFERADRPESVTLTPLPSTPRLACVAILIGVGLSPSIARAFEGLEERPS